MVYAVCFLNYYTLCVPLGELVWSRLCSKLFPSDRHLHGMDSIFFESQFLGFFLMGKIERYCLPQDSSSVVRAWPIHGEAYASTPGETSQQNLSVSHLGYMGYKLYMKFFEGETLYFFLENLGSIHQYIICKMYMHMHHHLWQVQRIRREPTYDRTHTCTNLHQFCLPQIIHFTTGNYPCFHLNAHPLLYWCHQILFWQLSAFWILSLSVWMWFFSHIAFLSFLSSNSPVFDFFIYLFDGWLQSIFIRATCWDFWFTFLVFLHPLSWREALPVKSPVILFYPYAFIYF